MSETVKLTEAQTYEVDVEMGNQRISRVYSARSAGAARAEAWRSFSSAWECTFKDFLRISRTRACPVPDDDGYSYVRRYYGVDPKIGERVRLINEGSSTGLEGTVIYPGPYTAHVHVMIDGRKYSSTVHPMNIERLALRNKEHG